MNRREFLRAAAGGMLAAWGGSGFLEPHRLEISRRAIRLRAGAGRVARVAHLSDLHMPEDVSFTLLKDAVAGVLAARPDLILVTGDFISRSIPRERRWAEQLMRLPAAAPTFACMGNHDGGRWAARLRGYHSSAPVRDWLGELGIRCLHNESFFFEVHGVRLRLVGVGDLWADELDEVSAFEGGRGGEAAAALLLCHNPDAKDRLFRYPWDVMFAGHTHGGQLILPLLGWAPLVPIQDLAFTAGLVPWGRRWVHVSRGLGTALSLRLNCLPEVTVMDLQL